MAKSSNQKLKLMYLMKVLSELTDEQHSITMSEIIDALKAYGINTERKSKCKRTWQMRLCGE